MKLNQHGSAGIIIIVLLGLSTLALGGLSVWALLNYSTAKTTVDQQREEAAMVARADQQKLDEAEFAERLKEPYRTYEAPPVFGAFTIKFPKNWNVYAEETSSGSTPVNVFMHPGLVRVDKGGSNTYAFRIQLVDKLYTSQITNYQRGVERGDLKAKSIKVSGISGVRFDGKIDRDHSGSIVLLPVRDKTLMLWTETNDYQKEYSKILQLAQISS